MNQTYHEIMSQPAVWAEALDRVPEQWTAISRSLTIDRATQALFIGSGTSLYIAQAAAQTFQEVTGCVSAAVPASEVFLSAASTVPRHQSVVAFVISRSGTTSEALLAATHLADHHPNVTTIGITCTGGTPLVAACDHAIELDHAREHAVVMTRSFTTMLMALQIVAAICAGDDRLRAELARLPDIADAALPEFEAFAQKMDGIPGQELVIYLGLGPNRGLAEEGTLKLKEMTQIPCEAYNPLEFRHGPISIVRAGTTAILLNGHREHPYTEAVERDLKDAGALVMSIGPTASTVADHSLVIGQELSDLARCCLYIPPVQLLAYFRALGRGLDPDRPRNLSLVVVLDAH
jgi:glucosamine--fructose-6-phosphate aminotransferase (isomerizing)